MNRRSVAVTYGFTFDHSVTAIIIDLALRDAAIRTPPESLNSVIGRFDTNPRPFTTLALFRARMTDEWLSDSADDILEQTFAIAKVSGERV